MNRTACRYAKCFSTALLAGAFVMSSEMPLLASPSQSSTASQQDKDNDPLPDAPQPQSQTSSSQQAPAAPSGAAGAKAANVKGAPTAKPVGAAVAPARQHGHRSLLIKLGLVAGAGIAVGSVVALAERSPSRPPGAASSNR
jgi:hypothetical protein